MSKPDAKTRILDDGLRYRSKVGGSPFAVDRNFSQATMSCFLCGTHRIRTTMATRKFLGKSQAVCAPSCQAAKEASAAAARALLAPSPSGGPTEPA
jgi:hypothetical protein